MSYRSKPGDKVIEKPPAGPDARGNVRVYADLPSGVVRRLNILAATLALSKRALLAKLVTEAVDKAGIK